MARRYKKQDNEPLKDIGYLLIICIAIGSTSGIIICVFVAILESLKWVIK